MTTRSLAFLTLALGVGLVAPMPVLAAPYDQPATQLRLTLGRTLAEHAFLTLEAMRTGIEEGSAFSAAGEALEANTVEILALVEAAYGAGPAEAFGDLWRAHIGYVVDYTRALADRDAAAQQRAIDQLHVYALDAAEVLSNLNPNLTVESVQALLEDHIRQLEQVAAFAEGNYADAYPAVRETYAHMFTIADGLAKAIALHLPERFAGLSAASSPATDLAVALDRLLGEHALFGVLATRATLADSPDRDAAVAALEANSADLGEAIGDIYGREAEQAFDRVWSAHVEAYLDYVRARQDEDADAMEAAREDLADYRMSFSEFVAGANPNLSVDRLEALLHTHTEHLRQQVDAFAEEDYSTAYELTREAYAHMSELGEELAAAIAQQFPERFLPDTASAIPEGPILPPQAVGVFLLMCAAALTSRVIRRIRWDVR